MFVKAAGSRRPVTSAGPGCRRPTYPLSPHGASQHPMINHQKTKPSSQCFAPYHTMVRPIPGNGSEHLSQWFASFERLKINSQSKPVFEADGWSRAADLLITNQKEQAFTISPKPGNNLDFPLLISISSNYPIPV